MKYLQPPNLVDAVIAVTLGTAPYWVEGFASTRAPLWAFVAAIGLGFGVYFLLGAARRHRRERLRHDEERHQELLERIDRLSDALGSARRPPRRN